MVRRAASGSDYRALARARLPHFLFEYIDGGANDEMTMRRNVADLAEVALRQRVLTGIDKVDLSTRLFGRECAMPLALAPIGLGGMTARRGEVQAVRAAAKAGVPFTLSTVAACPIAEVAAAGAGPFWFQLYMVRDRAFMETLLAAARDAGCDALLFTVDLPLPGSRYRDARAGLGAAPGMAGKLRRAFQAAKRPGWAWDVGLHGRPHGLGNLAPVLGRENALQDYFGWMARNFDGSVTWDDIAWVRSRWQGPLLLKGILDRDDAIEAAKCGVDGIVVSNHGGRQLDGVLSSARALPAIADAVGDALTVLADGGVRSGLDVVRMLALGAKGVLIGRPWVFALGARGQAGVEHLLALMANEMRVAMTLTGCRDIAAITRDALAEWPGP